MPTLEVLERARRGEAADSADIAALVNAWSVGAASDAQMAAWCATAGLGDMSYDASLALVRTLLGSGDRLELQSLGPVVDIRSTGGVGESALVIAASCIAAASGAIVVSTGAPSIAHVGGVLDAVAAATGAVAEMPVGQWVTQARDVGMVIAEPGDRLVPDERRLMSLRESTATAGSDVLVAVSAASRAISGGAGVIAVSVPAGQAGLLPGLDDAQAVAGLIDRLGAEWNRTVVTVPVARDEPVAGVAGHALEVREALAVLRGEGDAGLADASAALAAAALGAAGLDGDVASARATLGDGRAAAMAGRWIAAQGGDATAVDHPESLPQALLRHTVEAVHSGEVTHVDGGIVGSAARWLGAGRLDPGQVIDPSVGVEVVARPGTPVAAGDVLAVVHASDAWMAARALEMLQGAFRVAA